MKRLSFIPVVCALLALSLVSCLKEKEGQNYEVFPQMLTVVGEDTETNSPTLNFLLQRGNTDLYMEVLARELPDKYHEKGTTLLTYFKIDYNNQEVGNYQLLKASDVEVLSEIPPLDFIPNDNFKPGEELGSNVYPIALTQYHFSRNQMGRIFMATRINEALKENVNYKLIYTPEKQTDSENVLHKLYLYAEGSGGDMNVGEGRQDITAFNLTSLFGDSEIGQDSTLISTGIGCRFIEVYLYYHYKNNNIGLPEWELLNENLQTPIKLLMYKKDLE